MNRWQRSVFMCTWVYMWLWMRVYKISWYLFRNFRAKTNFKRCLLTSRLVGSSFVWSIKHTKLFSISFAFIPAIVHSGSRNIFLCLEYIYIRKSFQSHMCRQADRAFFPYLLLKLAYEPFLTIKCNISIPIKWLKAHPKTKATAHSHNRWPSHNPNALQPSLWNYLTMYMWSEGISWKTSLYTTPILIGDSTSTSTKYPKNQIV